jgi:hypothetical protein
MRDSRDKTESCQSVPISEFTKGSKAALSHIGLLLILFLSGFTIFMISIHHYQPVKFLPIVFPFVAVALFLAFIYRKNLKKRTQEFLPKEILWLPLSSFLTLGIFLPGAFMLSNGYFDTSLNKKLDLQVMDKYIIQTPGDHKSSGVDLHFLTVSSWNNTGKSLNFFATPSQYKSAKKGETIILFLYPGYLNFEWIEFSEKTK